MAQASTYNAFMSGFGRRFRMFRVLFLTCTMAWAQQTAPNTNGQSPAEWKIEYHEAGGIAGRILNIAVTSAGVVSAKGGAVGGWETTFQASAEQLAELQSLINALKLPGAAQTPPPGKDHPIPDMLYKKLEVTRGGHVYPVDSAPPGLMEILRALLAQGEKRAEDEKWTKAGPFRLGRVWHVREEVRDAEGMWHGEQWNGTWTRQNDSNVFNAVWYNNKTNQEVRDTIEIDSVERGRILLRRTTTKWQYNGWYAADRQNEVNGSVNSCRYCSWHAQIEY